MNNKTILVEKRKEDQIEERREGMKTRILDEVQEQTQDSRGGSEGCQIW